jgi:isopentenyldiphosphate isomerase
MEEEYLDIVDEDDKVTGRDTRDNVHKNYQIHRGIHVLVINSKGEILIQKRSKNKSYYPGYYDASVGAQVKSGETYEEAALRETNEELGFIPDNLIKICDYKSYSERQRENRRLFICHHEGPFEFDHTELEAVKFILPTEIQKMIDGGEPFTEGFKTSFKLITA